MDSICRPGSIILSDYSAQKQLFPLSLFQIGAYDANDGQVEIFGKNKR